VNRLHSPPAPFDAANSKRLFEKATRTDPVGTESDELAEVTNVVILWAKTHRVVACVERHYSPKVQSAHFAKKKRSPALLASSILRSKVLVQNQVPVQHALGPI
jgi:hypothetical protein